MPSSIEIRKLSSGKWSVDSKAGTIPFLVLSDYALRELLQAAIDAGLVNTDSAA